MSGIYRKATVYVQKMPAGRLEETEDGYRFAYFPEYCDREGAIAVSLTLPLRMEPYSSKVLFSFFDGLIPEGWLLRVTQETWKLDYRDRFGVLLAAGNWTTGTVLECCWLRAVIVLEMSVFKERSDNALLVLWKGNVRKNL